MNLEIEENIADLTIETLEIWAKTTVRSTTVKIIATNIKKVEMISTGYKDRARKEEDGKKEKESEKEK